MNDRIKTMWETAAQRDDLWAQARYEKFAELIVRECAEMVRIQNEQFMQNESHYGVVSTDVLKHFGVEE